MTLTEQARLSGAIEDFRWALDPVAFAEEGLDLTLDEWQKRVLGWHGKRLLLNCSRQSGKSFIAALKSLHTALYEAESLTLLISASQEQASVLFGVIRRMSLLLPRCLDKTEDNKLSATFANGSRIKSLPSREGTIRGYSSVSLIVVAEAAKVEDEVYMTVRPMLAVSCGTLMLMSTPFGKRGFFFREWTEGGDDWERVKITADDCPRISKEHLEQERRTLSEWWFRQEYYCEFCETVDQVFTHEEITQAISAGVEEGIEAWHL